MILRKQTETEQQAVGVWPVVEVAAVVVALDVGEHVVSPGDLFLLCSDGLTDMLPDDAIAQLLKSTSSDDILAQTLVDAANAEGGKDNISVILVRATGGRPKRSLLPRWWTR